MRRACRSLGAVAKRLGLTIALAAAMAAAPPVAAAPISFNVLRGDDTIDVQASATVRADITTAWRVLSDYDRYTGFIPDLLRSQVVARSGSKVTVEQSGLAVLWLLKMPVEVTFEIDENPPHGLQSRAVAGSLRSLTSTYVLTPVISGTRLDYLGHVATGFEFFGRIETYAVRENVARQFQALVDEIERVAAATGRAHALESPTPVTGSQ